jgi:hypothetical protein
MVKQQRGGGRMTVEMSAAPQASYDEWRTRRWRLTGLALAILWLATAVSVVLVGEKRADLHTLLVAVGDGSVTEVEIVGLPIDPDWRGRAQVTLKWRGQVLERFAEVVVDTRRRPGSSEVRDRIVGDPATYVRSGAPRPNLDVTYSRHTGFQEWREWRAPGWVAAIGLTAWFGTVMLAGAGPQSWRATPWAWIWLILFSGPLGAVAYLLLGGPLGLWRPREPARRLTGGWAFLIAMVLFGGANAG